jgi:SAM-dependent methyltransferase
VILGTAAVEQFDMVERLAARHGGRIVVGIDARDGRVATRGWVDLTEIDAVDLGRRVAAAGVERVVYTDIARDGRLAGPNVEATARLARETLGPGSRIVGVDIAPAMLAVARSIDSSIDWREGTVMSLPVTDQESFSMLTCHQGLQFFPDKAAAVSEMRRVLAPGGRVAIATWRSLQDNPLVLELNAVAEQHVGTIVASRHSFGSADTLNALLVDGGFRQVSVQTCSHDVTFADGALFARLNAMAVIGMSEKGKGVSDAARGQLAGQITADSQAVIDRYSRNGAFVFTLSTNIATARA